MSNVSKISSVAPMGYSGYKVEVECDITKGLPSLQIVGLGNKSIDEAKERVKSALLNSMLEYPARRITVNLAPAETPKDGTHYDLPIAVSILASSGQLRNEHLKDTVFAGELSLDGTLRPVPGAIILAETAKKLGYKYLILPDKNAPQASIVKGIEIIGADSLKSVFLHLRNETQLGVYKNNYSNDNPINVDKLSTEDTVIDDIFGQEVAKRALIIAAAGHHNILLTGSPGAGKTMLAKALKALLPKLTYQEAIEVTKIYSLTGENIEGIISERPFRAPHHSASSIAIIGGGSHPAPGEISLAHKGILFLDEIPEYPRSTLESLRQPLEDKIISISRASRKVTFPADFMLVATMNPCPCGYYGDTTKECTCSMTQIIAYQKRLSGPLLDRIDMVVPVSKVSYSKLLHNKSKTKQQQLSAIKLIRMARNMQSNRYKSNNIYNGNITNKDFQLSVTIIPETKKFLDDVSEKLQLSSRSYFKIIRLAQTIADLDGQETITKANIAEAVQYRKI